MSIIYNKYYNFYLIFASSGNRTQGDRLEGEHVTITPTMLYTIKKYLNIIIQKKENKKRKKGKGKGKGKGKHVKKENPRRDSNQQLPD